MCVCVYVCVGVKVATGQGKVREFQGHGQIREYYFGSGNFKFSGKLGKFCKLA